MKKELSGIQMKEDMRHNYLYHILFDNFASKEKCLATALEEQERSGRTAPLYNLGNGELPTNSEMLLPGGNERTYITFGKLRTNENDDIA